MDNSKWRSRITAFAIVDAILVAHQCFLLIFLSCGMLLWNGNGQHNFWRWTGLGNPKRYDPAFATLFCFLNSTSAYALLMATKTISETFPAMASVTFWLVARGISTVVCMAFIGPLLAIKILALVPVGWYIWTVLGTIILYQSTLAGQTENGLPPIRTHDNLKWRSRAKCVAIVEAILAGIHFVLYISIAIRTLVMMGNFIEPKWQILFFLNAVLCLVNFLIVWRLWLACKRECIAHAAVANAYVWVVVRVIQTITSIVVLKQILHLFGTEVAWLVAAASCWPVWSISTVLVYIYEVQSTREYFNALAGDLGNGDTLEDLEEVGM